MLNNMDRAPLSTRRRLPPAERRAQLLDCALAVFARRGIGAGRHAEVAGEAGVSVATTFVYFPTRADLVDAVLDEVGRFYTEIALGVHDSADPAPVVLQAHAAAFAASVDTHPDHARIWLDWSSAVRDDVWPRYQAMEDGVVAIIAGTLARGQREGTLTPDIHPDDGARIAIGAGHMIARMKLSGRPEAEVERFLGAMVRSLASGLTSAEAAGSATS
jgi:TetR/AcrR family hemagglutinin/protease transcriptional regulator